jgi:hypothetical protein
VPDKLESQQQGKGFFSRSRKGLKEKRKILYHQPKGDRPSLRALRLRETSAFHLIRIWF